MEKILLKNKSCTVGSQRKTYGAILMKEKNGQDRRVILSFYFYFFSALALVCIFGLT